MYNNGKKVFYYANKTSVTTATTAKVVLIVLVSILSTKTIIL